MVQQEFQLANKIQKDKLGIFNNNILTPKLTPELIKDFKQLDEYSRQAEVITKYKLKSEDDIKKNRK